MTRTGVFTFWGPGQTNTILTTSVSAQLQPLHPVRNLRPREVPKVPPQVGVRAATENNPLVPTPKSQLLPLQKVSKPADITLVARDQPWWKHLHHRNQQMLQIRVYLLSYPQSWLLSIYQCTPDIPSLSCMFYLCVLDFAVCSCNGPSTLRCVKENWVKVDCAVTWVSYFFFPSGTCIPTNTW